MDKLPNEILDLILNEADFRGWKALRPTCKKLACLTTPRLFEHVHCGLFVESIQKVHSIATTTHLSPLVKKLTYHAELLPYFEDVDAWEKFINLRPPFSLYYQIHCFERGLPILPSGDMSYREAKSAALTIWEKLPRYDPALDLEHHYRQYQRYYEEQQDWSEERSEPFLHALSQLPNLVHAEVSGQEIGNPKNHGPVWSTLLPEILQGPDNWKFIDSNEEDSLGKSLDGAQQITDLLKAICQRQNCRNVQPLQSLKFSTDNNVFWSQAMQNPGPQKSYVGFNPLEVEPRVFAMKSAFGQLTSLNLSVEFDAQQDRREWIAGGMRTFLREAKALQDLRLGYIGGLRSIFHSEDPDQHLSDALQVLGDIHWSTLRSLTYSFKTEEDLLIDLLKRHCSTLRRLQLIDMTFAPGGTWASVNLQIPHILKLEHVYFESLCDKITGYGGAGLFELWEDGAYERSILNYCLHGGPPPIIYPRDWNTAHPDQPIVDHLTGDPEADEDAYSTTVAEEGEEI